MNEVYDLHRPHVPIPGYPHAPADWSEEEAVNLAQEENLQLGEEHLEVLRALQEYFSRHELHDVNARELHDALDEKFHIRDFHDTILGAGAVPLSILERVVDNWIDNTIRGRP